MGECHFQTQENAVEQPGFRLGHEGQNQDTGVFPESNQPAANSDAVLFTHLLNLCRVEVRASVDERSVNSENFIS